jgi:hypothetical protein
MKRAVLVGMISLCGIANAFGESYTDTKKRDFSTYLSDYNVATAFCGQKYAEQTSASAYRKCMLNRGFKWHASGPSDNAYDPMFGTNGISH